MDKQTYRQMARWINRQKKGEKQTRHKYKKWDFLLQRLNLKLWTYEHMYKQTSGQREIQTDGQSDKQTDRCTDR